MTIKGKWATWAGSVAIVAITSSSAFAEKSMQDMEIEMNAMKLEMEELKKKVDDKSSVKAPKKDFYVKLGGRLFADAAWITDDDDTIDVNATEFRTVRLRAYGQAGKSIKYKVEADFAGDEVTLKDANLSIKTGTGASVVLGQFKTPNSLDEQTSSRHISLMERGSFTDAFGLARRIGVGVSTGGDNWTAKLGVFRGDASSGVEDEGHEIAGRATFSPKANNVQLHFGGSFRLRDAGGMSDYKYSQRPHQHLSPTKFVSTGSIGPEDTFFGIEAAMLSGPFWAAAEYAVLEADDGSPASDPTFGGGYIEAGVFLTGESRGYKANKGAWDRPKVDNPIGEGGHGAWALVGRYDTIDLSDAGWFGGVQDTYIIGVNWYLNRYTRLMANYNHSEIEDAFDVAANGFDGKNEVSGFGLRAQIDW